MMRKKLTKLISNLKTKNYIKYIYIFSHIKLFAINNNYNDNIHNYEIMLK